MTGPMPSLSRSPAAVDDDTRAEHVRRSVRREEDGGAGDVVHDADPPRGGGASIASSYAGSANRCSFIGVRMFPGAMQLNHTPPRHTRVSALST